jgi:hypothetical protein
LLNPRITPSAAAQRKQARQAMLPIVIDDTLHPIQFRDSPGLPDCGEFALSGFRNRERRAILFGEADRSKKVAVKPRKRPARFVGFVRTVWSIKFSKPRDTPSFPRAEKQSLPCSRLTPQIQHNRVHLPHKNLRAAQRIHASVVRRMQFDPQISQTCGVAVGEFSR